MGKDADTIVMDKDAGIHMTFVRELAYQKKYSVNFPSLFLQRKVLKPKMIILENSYPVLVESRRLLPAEPAGISACYSRTSPSLCTF